MQQESCTGRQRPGAGSDLVQAYMQDHIMQHRELSDRSYLLPPHTHSLSHLTAALHTTGAPPTHPSDLVSVEEQVLDSPGCPLPRHCQGLQSILCGIQSTQPGQGVEGERGEGRGGERGGEGGEGREEEKGGEGRGGRRGEGGGEGRGGEGREERGGEGEGREEERGGRRRGEGGEGRGGRREGSEERGGEGGERRGRRRGERKLERLSLLQSTMIDNQCKAGNSCLFAV